MFHKHANFFLLIGIAIFISFTFYSPAQAANCGGATPCACGDNVVANRTLVSDVDPIIQTVCTGNGLIMNTAGVVLDLNGNKLHGSGNGAGVLIAADNVTIEDSPGIENFGHGISTASTTKGSTIDGVRPNANVVDGIFLEGDNNELIAILSKRNGNNGVTVIGNNNTLQGHNDEYNGFHGIFVQGDGNELIGNLASENRKRGPGAGIMVMGDNNKINQSKISKMNTWGIAVLGNLNQLTANQVQKQDDDGITVEGADNVLTNNKSTNNKGVGIVVVGAGDPAASTGNIVSGNRQAPQCSIYGVTAQPTCIQK